MPTFQLPKVTILDLNGDPVSGGKLWFYETGTSTPLATYQDEALTTANTNPVVADSAGRAGPIFLQPTKTYKLVVTDASDVTIYTTDPLKALSLATGSGSDRISNIAVTPLDYGAIGDGVADEASEVQQAINAATGTVSLAGKIFRCDSSLTLRENIRIVDGTLHFAQNTDATCLQGLGTVGSSILLTADGEAADTTLTMGDTSTLSRGDYLLVQDSQQFDTNNSVNNGEIVRIRSVDSGTQITIDEKLTSTYAIAQSASVKLLDTFDGVVFEDVKIICGNAATQDCIRLDYSHKASFRNVTITDITRDAILFNTGLNARVKGCTFEAKGSGSGESGVALKGASRWSEVEGSTFHNFATGVEFLGDTVGVVRDCSVAGCGITGGTTAIDVNAGTSGIACTGNTVKGGASTATGVRVFGDAFTITGNTISLAQTNGVSISPRRTLAVTTPAGNTPALRPEQVTGTVSGNAIDLCGSNGVSVSMLTSGVVPIGSLTIGNNAIAGCGANAVDIALNASLTHQGITVIGNTCSNIAAASIELTATGDTVKGFGVHGNSCIDGGAAGVQITTASSAVMESTTVTGNKFAGNTGANILFAVNSGTCNDVAIEGNVIDDGSYAIRVDVDAAATADNYAIAGNTIRNSTLGISVECDAVQQNYNISGNTYYGASDDCILVDDVENSTIASNSIINTASGGTHYCIRVLASEYVTVASNSIRMTAGTGVYFDATRKSSATGNGISGTSTATALYGVRTSTSLGDDNTISSNTIVSCNVGIYVAENGVTVVGNFIRDCGDAGINSDDLFDANISSNNIYLTNGVGILCTGSTQQVVFNGNHIDDAGSEGVFFDLAASDDLDRVSFTCNRIDNPTGPCVLIDGVSSSNQMAWCLFASNYFHQSGIGANGITITDLTLLQKCHFNGNTFYQCTDGIAFPSIAETDVVVQNNVFFDGTNNTSGLAAGNYDASQTVGASEQNYNINN